MNQSLMDQIVYSPQVLLQPTKNQTSKRDNVFLLGTEQFKLLNAMMPVGYIILPRQKNQQLQVRKRDSLQPIYQYENVNQSFFDEPKHESIFSEKPDVQIKCKLSFYEELNPEMQKCMTILTSLKNHPQSIVFLDPVDTTIITDYLDYVSQPIDLGTIEYNINNEVYQNISQFVSDVKKTWLNAYKYNPRGTPIYNITVEIDRYFDKLLRENSISIPAYQPPMFFREQTMSIPRPQPIKKRPQPLTPYNDIPLTMQQKRNLGTLIKRLPHEHLSGVWQIVSTISNAAYQQLQFDIETLPARKARQLQMYVKKIFAQIDARNKQTTSFYSNPNQNASQNESSFMIDEDSD